ncbi:MAG: extracellular solute-binding protein [Parcubacteria group bacterium]|nr:extracellular solute-binding protein [Parcubacteria group bacterium]
MQFNAFQFTLLGIFGAFLIVSVVIFSGLIPIGSGAPEGVGGTVTVWGTVSALRLSEPLAVLNAENKEVFEIQYVEKDARSFDIELIEALAADRGPDLILLPHNLTFRHKDKIFPIPYESFSERNFRDTYIEAGELYLTKDGILALPFTIDPLVMYYNRSILSGAGVVKAPSSWDEFFLLGEKLTKKDTAGNIQTSAVALGEYRNIKNAKDILSLLMLQSGNPIVEEDGGLYRVLLSERLGLVVPPSESALRFFTEFSNPVKPMYSWNRALPEAQDLFAANDLAIYFGYASEKREIEAKSPRLNFDVAPMPQVRDGREVTTSGKMTGVAVLKRSDNLATAFYAAYALAGTPFLQSMLERDTLPPVRRDLLVRKPTDSVGQVFYDSALTVRLWLDPNPEATGRIFQDMIETVVSGRRTVAEAISRGAIELAELFPANP